MGSVSPNHQPWDYWGVDEASWPAALFDVPTFLRQAELNYEALVELLFTRYINPFRGKVIIIPPGLPLPDLPLGPIEIGISISFSAPCTLEGATLNRLEPALDRIHRFLRLQKPWAGRRWNWTKPSRPCRRWISPPSS
jgi:hypothetical protein